MNLCLQFDLAALVEFCISWILLCGEIDNQKGNCTCLQIKHFCSEWLSSSVMSGREGGGAPLNASSCKSTMANVQQRTRVKTNQIISSTTSLLCFVCRGLLIPCLLMNGADKHRRSCCIQLIPVL